MTRSPALTCPAQTGAIASRSFAQATAVGAVLLLLAAVGSLVFRLATRVQQAGLAWAERRRQHAEDRKLWELALGDSRVMADLVALSQQNARGTSRFF